MKNNTKNISICLCLCLLLVIPFGVYADEEKLAATNNTMLDTWIKRFDKKVVSKTELWQMAYQNMTIYVLSDESTDRMRVLVEIADSAQLEKEHLYPLMQANFDSAFDARYAVAQGSLWRAFVHPLSHLGEKGFFYGLSQVIILARTFGTYFSSGFSSGFSPDTLTFNGDTASTHGKSLSRNFEKRFVTMKAKLMAYLMRSPLTVLCLMTVSFLGFGYFSVNLFLLFKANVELINNFGVVAIQEGAAKQLVLIIFNAFISVLFYAVWKVGERLLVDSVVNLQD